MSESRTDTPAKAAYPVTDRVQEALRVSLRGCEELLPQADWVQKLARSEATGCLLYTSPSPRD